ncbi:hypothetical protein F993_01538 [Acinetobacter proteolyticus]|uniref:Preprotein translocase subunit SecB n=1 Tax=Acinetobacter proteolyticus TaxID=1776741 RepID=A0ABN0JG57_9GAMM|nr:protein-export chaperone SecB [Acinetobacter proteolyticus]ENU24222.1 hypothetical protein F993_01538 [Acinetobacter proteolyticus]
MKFRFLDVKAPQVVFRHSEKMMEYLYAFEEDDNKNFPPIEFDVVTPASADKEDNFFILFKIRIDKSVYLSQGDEEDEDDSGIFAIKLICSFKTNKLIEDGFGNTDLARVLAPQAAYPFVRSWISNFFTQNGFDAVYFPIYNFDKSEKVD